VKKYYDDLTHIVSRTFALVCNEAVKLLRTKRTSTDLFKTWSPNCITTVDNYWEASSINGEFTQNIHLHELKWTLTM